MKQRDRFQINRRAQQKYGERSLTWVDAANFAIQEVQRALRQPIIREITRILDGKVGGPSTITISVPARKRGR